MKNLTSTEILEIINRDVALRADIMYQGSELFPSSQGRKHYFAQNAHVELSSHAEQMLLARIRVPAEYVHRCPLSLQTQNVSYWLNEYAKKSFFFRYSNYSALTVRAVFGSRFNADLDDHRVIPLFLNALSSQPIDFPEVRRDEHLTVLTGAFRDMLSTHEGRTFVPAVALCNSEVGCSALHIKPAVLNVANGRYFSYYSGQLVGRTSFRHTQELNTGKIHQAVEHASRSAQYGVHRLFETMHEQVAKPLDVITKLVDDSQVLGNNILDAFKAEYETLQHATKFKIAQDILEACVNLPVFRQHQVTNEIGNFLDLFSADQKRLASILED